MSKTSRSSLALLLQSLSKWESSALSFRRVASPFHASILSDPIFAQRMMMRLGICVLMMELIVGVTIFLVGVSWSSEPVWSKQLLNSVTTSPMSPSLATLHTRQPRHILYQLKHPKPHPTSSVSWPLLKLSLNFSMSTSHSLYTMFPFPHHASQKSAWRN